MGLPFGFPFANMAEEEYNDVGLGAAITVSFRDGDGNGDPLFHSHCADVQGRQTCGACSHIQRFDLGRSEISSTMS